MSSRFEAGELAEQPVPYALSLERAAAYLGVSPRTLRRLIDSGTLPYSRPAGIAGSRIVIRRVDLEALVDDGLARNGGGA